YSLARDQVGQRGRDRQQRRAVRRGMRASWLGGPTPAHRALSLSGPARNLGGVSVQLDLPRAPRNPAQGAKALPRARRRAHGLWAGTRRGGLAPPAEPARPSLGEQRSLG